MRITGTVLYNGIILISCFLRASHASWWYLGVLGSAATPRLPSSKCDKLPFLSPRQKEICEGDPKVLTGISMAARVAIRECQWQFKGRRWNCTTFNNTNVFGGVQELKTREAAFIFGVSSASVAYAITKACSAGDLEGCFCDSRVEKLPTDGFSWGGCSDDVAWGTAFARRFLDNREHVTQPDSAVMNKWNNAAGRKAVKSTVVHKCKCHGVSGSCNLRVCWREMAKFRQIGNWLKEKFDGANLVKFESSPIARSAESKLVPADQDVKKPTKKDLVYMVQSPDFCRADNEGRWPGTQGRQCNKTSMGTDGCQLLCCGRGYKEAIVTREYDCRCKFFWCCEVKCDRCKTTELQYFCN